LVRFQQAASFGLLNSSHRLPGQPLSMTTVTSVNKSVSQQAPTRFFGLQVVYTIDDFYQARDTAYGMMVANIDAMGGNTANYDVRPVSPIDDFGLLQGSPTNNYAGDWSISSGSISDTAGSLGTAGNPILKGTMPQNRWLTMYGTQLLSNPPGPEIAWKFLSGANIKTIWLLQDIWGWQDVTRPKCISTTIPSWNPSDLIAHTLYATGSRIVYDVHWTLWAEPVGYTISAANLTA
jgi:hypothetical protein